LEGKAVVDQTSITGVKVEINDPSAVNGTIATVTSINFGVTLPPDANLAVNGAVYYDIKVIGQTSFGPDATVTITITNPAFTSQDNQLAYFYGNQWIYVPCTYIAPDKITATLPANVLTGTPIAIIKASVADQSGIPILPIALAAVIIALLVIAFVFYRRKGRSATPT
jgi:hypothetical protein